MTETEEMILVRRGRIEHLETFKAEAQRQLAEQQETIWQLRAGLAAHAKAAAQTLYPEPGGRI